MIKQGWLRLACLLCVPVLLGLAPVVVQAWNDDTVGTPEQVAQNPPPAVPHKPAAPPQDKDAKRFKEVDEVTKDMTTTKGLFTLYRFDPADKKRDPEKLLAKIPQALLGQDMLLAMSLSRGPMAGWMWGDEVVRWEVVGSQLKLVVPNVRYVRPPDAAVTGAVERTYNDRYLTAVPIVAMSGQGDVVIDFGKLLKSDLAGVSRFGGAVRPDLSTWAKTKVFPDNVLIDVDLALGGKRGGNIVGVTYSFRRLPKPGSYTPRRADPRVGYFLTAQRDWSKKPDARTTFDRYINRWKLEKQDPSLELSPPKEPIVFIIEQTVPIQWRRWVREGILEWNRAFEQIGFVNAVVVQQQTAGNEYADHDPEDARHNFIRWGVSGRAFAMGPSRADPRTGQILDADIIFDDAFVRALMYEFDVFTPTALADSKGPGFRRWVEEQPQMVPAFLRERLEREQQDPEVQRWAELEEELHEQGRCTCAYARGMQQQLALVHYALTAGAAAGSDGKLPERLIGEAIRETVTHEVGHTLGLRHNFKASAWLTLDEIRRRRDATDEPTTASVMDYNPLLLFAEDKLEDVRHFVSPTIGPYDEWAIEYGYAIAQGQPEEELLEKITSRCAEPALRYATDEDTMWVYSPDPLVNRYDMSSSPIDYARSRIALVDGLLGDVTKWAVRDGEPWYHLRRAFNVLWFERARNLEYVGRVIGGQYFNRDHKADPDAQPPFVLVEAAEQRAALAFLAETVFDSSFFEMDGELLNMLAPSRWSHWGSRMALRLDYPIHDRIRIMQAGTLMSVTAPPVLQRIYDAELKCDGDDKFTAAELITTLRDHIWRQLEQPGSGTYSDAQPFIDSVARTLQRLHLEMLLSAVRMRAGTVMSADLQSMTRLAVAELADRIGRTLEHEQRLDFASRAHLHECRSLIERVLEAQFQAR